LIQVLLLLCRDGDGDERWLRLLPASYRESGNLQGESPLIFRGIAVRSLHAEEQFNVLQWSSSEGTSYTLSVEAGVIHSPLPDGAVNTKKKK
jgi:hypothetical protein